MDIPERRTARLMYRRRRLPRPYVARPLAPPRLPAAPAPPPLPVLRRVLAGLRSLPEAAPAPAAPAAPADLCAELAALTRRLVARDPALAVPAEEREPSPDVVITREIPIVTAGGPR